MKVKSENNGADLSEESVEVANKLNNANVNTPGISPGLDSALFNIAVLYEENGLPWIDI